MQKNTIILLNKKPDVTSFQCLSPLKRQICKKAGHAGTLDKFASGLIISFTGKFTKLNSIFMGLDKVYEATICFGLGTDTLDPEGKITSKGRIPNLFEIEEALKEFNGTIDQVPPIYSALHINGKRAYSMAREGKDFEIDSRKVSIYDYKIISYSKPLLKIKIKVSKGFYVRSFARDLANSLLTSGYLVDLKRTSIGNFNLNEAIDYDDIKSLKKAGEDFTLDSIISRMDSFTKIYLNESEAAGLYYGNLPDLSKYLSKAKKYIIFIQGNKVLAIVDSEKKKTICQVVAT